MTAVLVDSLQKTYGGRRVVDGASFAIQEGEVFCILGPNGAGKTTTVEILEGLRDRDAGRVEVLGTDPAVADRSWRARVGVVPQETASAYAGSVRGVIDTYRRYYPEPRSAAELLQIADLEHVASARIRDLSGGETRRLDLALGLAGRPEVLFLDEPTTGFDPVARRQAWGTIAALAEGGTTVILTTHFMEEAQRLADRVAVFRDGKVIATGSPAELTANSPAPSTIRFSKPHEARLPPRLRSRMTVGDDVVAISSTEPMRDVHELTGWAVDRGLVLDNLAVEPPTLEDVYVALTDPSRGWS